MKNKNPIDPIQHTAVCQLHLLQHLHKTRQNTETVQSSVTVSKRKIQILGTALCEIH